MQHTPKGATWGEHTPMTNYPSDEILKLSAAQLFWEVSFLNRREIGDSWAACLFRLHTCTPESGQFRAQLLSPASVAVVVLCTTQHVAENALEIRDTLDPQATCGDHAITPQGFIHDTLAQM